MWAHKLIKKNWLCSVTLCRGQFSPQCSLCTWWLYVSSGVVVRVWGQRGLCGQQLPRGHWGHYRAPHNRKHIPINLTWKSNQSDIEGSCRVRIWRIVSQLVPNYSLFWRHDFTVNNQIYGTIFIKQSVNLTNTVKHHQIYFESNSSVIDKHKSMYKKYYNRCPLFKELQGPGHYVLFSKLYS